MGCTLKDSFKFRRYNIYRQEEDRECFYTLCPLFLNKHCICGHKCYF